jgi:N-acetylglucosaminyldiphosphoundecaprenol N-acetyl-beta-D-mannosaminyltransferase
MSSHALAPPAPDGATTPRRRVLLLGMPIDVVTERDAVARVVGGGGGVTVTPNLEHLRRFRADADVRRFYGTADLVPADGMPLVWASRIAGTPLPERVAGSNLIWSISESAAKRGRSVYLLGGSPGTARRAADVLRDRFPGLVIAGTAAAPVGFDRDAAQLAAMADGVAASQADIVFVGLPLDKQIAVIDRLRGRAPQTWFLGVGVSFSFVCGEIARAPRWMQRLGIEWLHRLAHEPRRLARRYLLDGVPFALEVLARAAALRVARAARRARTRPGPAT